MCDGLKDLGGGTNLIYLKTYSLFESEQGFPYTAKSFLKSLSEIKASQMVIKEKPRKRPSAPPNSATRDCQGYTSSSVSTWTNIFYVQAVKPTVVSLAAAIIPKPSVELIPGGIGWASPIRAYFLYLQGFLQPVLDEMNLTDPNCKLLYRWSSSLEKMLS